jgi:branched-chain amino acid transport system substrate-binding protein
MEEDFMRKKIASLLAIATLTMSFYGCGSKQEAAQGVTDKSIKVGNGVATSGALAPIGVPFKAGMEAYFKMVNENGGVDGRQIEYVHQDDEFNPEKGKAVLDKLVNDEKVFAIVGHFGTPVVGATLDDLKEIGIPAVYFATGTGILYNEKAAKGEGDNIFPVQPVYPMEGRIMTAWAKGEFDAKKIGVIYTNDDAGKDLVGGIEKEATNIGGIEVVSEQVPSGAEDVSAAVTKIKNANVDVVIIAGIQNTFPQVAKELAKQGNTKPALTTYVNVDKTMVEAIKADVAGKFDIYGNAWVDVTSDALANFQTWVKKASTEDFSANAYAMTGWIAGEFFVEGLKKVDGELTWENYIKAMEAEPIKNPFGGSIDFSGGKRLGTQEMSLAKMDTSSPTGWVPHVGFKSIDTILGK